MEKENIGQKFSKDKLPWWTVLFKQMPNAIEEIVRCSAAGNKKYPGDSDWKNFERVEDGQNQYKNAAIRHIKESENHTFNKDMSEYDPKVRHLAQAAWNLLILLELQIRDEQVEIKQVDYREINKDIHKTLGVEDTSQRGYIPESEGVIVGEHKKNLNILRELAKDTPKQESIPKYSISDEMNPNIKYEDLKVSVPVEDTERIHVKAFDELVDKFPPRFNSINHIAKKIGEQADYLKRQQEIIQGTVENGGTPYIFVPEEPIAVNTPHGIVHLGINETLTVSPTELKIEKREGSKVIINSYYDRPTLTIEKLLDREDEYPDFPEETNL